MRLLAEGEPEPDLLRGVAVPHAGLALGLSTVAPDGEAGCWPEPDAFEPAPPPGPGCRTAPVTGSKTVPSWAVTGACEGIGAGLTGPCTDIWCGGLLGQVCWVADAVAAGLVAVVVAPAPG